MTHARGFTVLALLLIVLAVVIGGAGYFYSNISTSSPAAVPHNEAQDSPGFASWLPVGSVAGDYAITPQSVSCFNEAISEADRASFQVSSAGIYAKDKVHVYHCVEIVTGADPTTFKAFEKGPTGFLDDPGHADVNRAGYGLDSAHVFIWGTLMPNADPSTFTFVLAKSLSYSYAYTKDKAHVFYGGQAIAGADPATFVPLYDTEGRAVEMFKDAKRVFAFQEDQEGNVKISSVPEADPATFSPDASGLFARDRTHIYGIEGNSHTTVIIGADPHTFMLLGTVTGDPGDGFSYFKDAQRVYYEDTEFYKTPPPDSWKIRPVQGADSGTFEVKTGNETFDARDKSHTYLGGKVVQ